MDGSETQPVNLTLNDLLSKAGLDLKAVRLMRHTGKAASPWMTHYELWRDDRPGFERYQADHSAKTHRMLIGSKQWASFVVTPQNETMFVGLYDVHDPQQSGERFVYETHKSSVLLEYEGRLHIDWGTGMLAWCQRADRNDKRITQIKKQFSEPAFPGYLRFVSTIAQVPGLPLSWIEALKSAKGVYVLTCPTTRELYVGSATGSAGFYGRWCEYARDGHGGNIQLKNRDRSDYQVTILEVAGSSLTSEDILALEGRWKQKLQTREMGLNSN